MNGYSSSKSVEKSPCVSSTFHTKEAKVKPIQNYYAFSVYINRIGMVGEHSILVFFDGDFNLAMAGMPLAWIRSN